MQHAYIQRDIKYFKFVLILKTRNHQFQNINSRIIDRAFKRLDKFWSVIDYTPDKVRRRKEKYYKNWVCDKWVSELYHWYYHLRFAVLRYCSIKMIAPKAKKIHQKLDCLYGTSMSKLSLNIMSKLAYKHFVHRTNWLNSWIRPAVAVILEQT